MSLLRIGEEPVAPFVSYAQNWIPFCNVLPPISGVMYRGFKAFKWRSRHVDGSESSLSQVQLQEDAT